ncbi:vascular endothelial growth factor A-like protein [Dinothrombium tinctorium]|uniref:Vascular endothelial growth factor A-like protein n=1 Tax=Dinothrombium tinctorium TaxID=1965070 RepID=A0A3S3PVW8_9ACAR|nr:vascular endothelial growth factor A-like protein [Dinothrombium tinctorium]
MTLSTKLPKLPKITAPAGCSPELKTVEIKSNAPESEIYFPWCVKLPRCSGCCSSRRLECVATKRTTVDITGVRLQYLAENSKFRLKGLKVFKMDKHEECSCQCIQKASDCNELQMYRAEECRCVCRDLQKVLQCIQQRNKFWDQGNCTCLCKSTLNCSTGLRFDQNTCRYLCELIKKKEDRSLTQYSPSILLTNDNHEILQRFKGGNEGISDGINPDHAGDLT